MLADMGRVIARAEFLGYLPESLRHVFAVFLYFKIKIKMERYRSGNKTTSLQVVYKKYYKQKSFTKTVKIKNCIHIKRVRYCHCKNIKRREETCRRPE